VRAERLESESDKENGVEYGNRVGEGLQGLLRGENHIVDAGDEFDWRRRKFFQFLCAKILTDRPAICSGGGGAFGPPPRGVVGAVGVKFCYPLGPICGGQWT